MAHYNEDVFTHTRERERERERERRIIPPRARARGRTRYARRERVKYRGSLGRTSGPNAFLLRYNTSRTRDILTLSIPPCGKAKAKFVCFCRAVDID